LKRLFPLLLLLLAGCDVRCDGWCPDPERDPGRDFHRELFREPRRPERVVPLWPEPPQVIVRPRENYAPSRRHD